MLGDVDTSKEMALIRDVAQRYPQATLTGPAAARVWGLATLAWVTSVDVIPPGRTRAKTRSGVSCTFRHGNVAEDRVSTLRGVRVAPVIVVLFDTYRYHGRLACLVALESARQKWPRLTVDKLLELSGGLPRAKGLRGFRQLIVDSVGTSESALETVVRDIVRRIEGVVRVEAQVRFVYTSEFGGVCAGRIDLVVNGIVAIECDGRAYHGHEISEAERHREKQLLNQGMVVLRVGWKEVDDGTLGELVARALRNVEQASRHSRRRGA